MTLLASDPGNTIRYNGSGRVYVAAYGETSYEDLGELESLNFGVAVSTEKIRTTRNASRATILEVETERDATLTIGLREQTEENLKMALLGAAVTAANQAAGSVFQTAPTLVADKYIDLGKVDVRSTKISGAITGTITVGDTVRGATSGATARVAYAGDDYIEVVEVSGTFQTSEEVYVYSGTGTTTTATIDPSTDMIVPTSVAEQEDVVVTSSDGATRRVNGTDYSLDPDYGLIRKLSAGDMAAGDVVSYDYEAKNINYIHGMSAGSVQRKILVVTDADDQGPRQRYTFWKVQINLNGEFPLLGEGAAILQCSGSVLKDTAQPSGQEYFKQETLG